MKKYIVISIVFHALLLINLTLTALDQQKKLFEVDARDVTPKSSEQQEVTLVPSDDEGNVATKEQSAPKHNCDYWYGGIGIVQDINNTVTEVFKGYIAHRSGIEKGDVIISKSEPEITGEPGTQIVLTIKKVNGTVIQILMMRERVCYVDS